MNIEMHLARQLQVSQQVVGSMWIMDQALHLSLIIVPGGSIRYFQVGRNATITLKSQV